jgi:hypothetical protein
MDMRRRDLRPSGPGATTGLAAGAGGRFVLRFESLSQPGQTLDIPCDGQGRVDLDALCEMARRNYLFARAVVGRGYNAPVLVGLRDPGGE